MDIVKFLSLLVLVANVTTLFTGAVIFLGKLKKIRKIGVIREIGEKSQIFIKKYSVRILLLVSATATLGSLYLSEIKGFTPCKLCWYQRILMYPMSVLFLTSIIKKTKDVFLYTLPLSLIGLLIAGYHYYLQLHPNPYAPCGDVGFSVNCSQNFFTYFGYITIPWMSFSAFLIIFSVSLLMLVKKK